ncbi:hypothetical protein [Mycolicibacterium arseniciresistens]|uniref:hypothetical protein n=1 Tax=Mycolicibacterium arseniciresistens TaxID=3062257 RepID=UPI003899392B
MGGRFADRIARQHPHLTAQQTRGLPAADSTLSDPVVRAIVLIVLAVDGIVCAALGALFLPLRIGVVPFPISAVVAGVVNAGLVWAATYWTDSTRLAATPLWTWLLTVAALTLGGPGGDIVFGGPGVMAYAVLVYLALGTAAPVWVLWRHNQRS